LMPLRKHRPGNFFSLPIALRHHRAKL